MDPTSKSIDGFTYTLMPLPAWQGLETLNALAKYLGPTGLALAAVKEGKDGALGGLASAVAQTLAVNTGPDLVALAKKLLSGCLVELDGKSVTLSSVDTLHFQGRILSLFKVLIWAVEVQYNDFFGALRSVFSSGKLAAKLQALGLTDATPISGPAGVSSTPAG